MEIDLFVKKISKNKIKIYKNDIQYKTISLILDSKKYHITSFRKDLITFGRHAYVSSVETLYEDALRRDFTVNAVYLNAKGDLIDPLGGLNDIINKELKFIGNPSERIKEDYLRVLRFCRFFASFPKKNISYNLKNMILSKLTNISILSNKRMKDEFTKLFLVEKFTISLAVMSELQIDRHILSDKKNEIHDGFKTNKFTTVKYIKSSALNIINQEKLDINSVLMPILYGFDNLDRIIHRFELNKKKINFNKFTFLLISISHLYDKKIFEPKNKRQKQINTLKFIWKMRCNIYPNNKTIFQNDKIPFNWYKLALFHIIPLNKLKAIDLCNMEWPIFPINRQQVEDMYIQKDYIQINNLINKAEQFWVNNDFKSSSDQIIIFLKTTLGGNDKI
jgi:poly(A) polymerase